jgi:putative peptidoglycan lipid II flippase
MRASLLKALRMVIFLGGLAAAAVLAAAQPAVVVAYERGAFGSDATIATAGALSFFALAIPFWGGHQLLGRAFYAQRRMWVPVGIGTAATLVSLPVYYWANEAIGSHGIALASTVGITLYAIGLGVAWFKGASDGAAILATMGRTAVGTAVAAAVGWWAVTSTVGAIETAGFGRSTLGLAVGAVVVGTTYLGAAKALRAPELSMLRRKK